MKRDPVRTLTGLAPCSLWSPQVFQHSVLWELLNTECYGLDKSQINAYEWEEGSLGGEDEKALWLVLAWETASVPVCTWQVTCTKVRLSESLSLSGVSVLVWLAWMSGRLTAPWIHGSCALSMSTELVLNLNMPDAYCWKRLSTCWPEPHPASISLGNGPYPGYLLNFAQALIWGVPALKWKPCHKHLAQWLKFRSQKLPLPLADLLLDEDTVCCSAFCTLQSLCPESPALVLCQR